MIVWYFIVWRGPLWKIELGEPISKTFQPMIFRNWLTPGMVNSIIVAKWILAEPFSIISQPIIFTNWLSSHLGWSTVLNQFSIIFQPIFVSWLTPGMVNSQKLQSFQVPHAPKKDFKSDGNHETDYHIFLYSIVCICCYFQRGRELKICSFLQMCQQFTHLTFHWAGRFFFTTSPIDLYLTRVGLICKGTGSTCENMTSFHPFFYMYDFSLFLP